MLNHFLQELMPVNPGNELPGAVVVGDICGVLGNYKTDNLLDGTIAPFLECLKYGMQYILLRASHGRIPFLYGFSIARNFHKMQCFSALPSLLPGKNEPYSEKNIPTPEKLPCIFRVKQP